jgi:hypothetical protein
MRGEWNGFSAPDQPGESQYIISRHADLYVESLGHKVRLHEDFSRQLPN